MEHAGRTLYAIEEPGRKRSLVIEIIAQQTSCGYGSIMALFKLFCWAITFIT